MIIHRENTIDYCINSFSVEFVNVMKELGINTIGQAWDYVLANPEGSNIRKYKSELLVYFQRCQSAQAWAETVLNKMCHKN